MPPMPITPEPPKVGDLAPDFTAKGTEGDEYRLSDLYQKSHILLIFYPKDQTTG
jgi:peroxiredoxin